MKTEEKDPRVLDSLIESFGVEIPAKWVPAWMLVNLREAVIALREVSNIANALLDHVSVISPIFDTLGHVNLKLTAEQQRLKADEASRAQEIRWELVDTAKTAGTKPPTEAAISTVVQSDGTMLKRRTQVESLASLRLWLMDLRTTALERRSVIVERSTNQRVYQRADAGAS